MVGRPIDSGQRPRDANGWIIPREGSKGRIVYALMQRGTYIRTIAKAINCTIPQASRTCWRIRNPDKVKLWHREAVRRQKASAHDSP